MMGKFYAEYTVDGIFYNGFYTHEQFANLTFCPDTEVLKICVPDKKTDSWKEVYRATRMKKNYAGGVNHVF